LFALPHPVLYKVPTPTNLAYRRALEHLNGVLREFITAQRNRGEDDSLLSMLVAARDDENLGMTDAQLLDELKTLFLAGYETSSNAIAWTIFLLAQHADVADELRCELDARLEGQPLLMRHLAELPVLDAVIRESLRLYPPAWNHARAALDDVRFGDALVRAGQLVMASQWVIHRDPRFYSCPNEFRPRRWLEGLARDLPEFAYIPFSAGIRKCIGDDFARLEIAVILAALCQRFTFNLEPGFQVELRAGLTLQPRRGVRIVIQRRAGFKGSITEGGV
jgi:cytochrome P450